MPASLIGRLTGPVAVAAGTFMVGAELVLLTFDMEDHVGTSTDPLFQVAQVVYLLGFIGLIVYLFAASHRNTKTESTFSVVATLTALLGTFMLGGDLWFESFAVPWIADEVPGAFDTDPTVVLALGAISSYFIFGLGWVLYGISGFRSGTLPRGLAVAVVVAGAVGSQALLPGFGIPLGLAVGAIGIWSLRSRSGAERELAATREPVSVG